MQNQDSMNSFVLKLYFAVVSAVTLFTFMFGLIDFLDIGLRTYVFNVADKPGYLLDCADRANLRSQFGYEFSKGAEPATDNDREPTSEELIARCEAQNETAWESYRIEKANRAIRNLALILVTAPLFAIHFRSVYKDWISSHNSTTSV